MTRSFALPVVAGLAFAAGPVLTADAALLAEGTYQLHNHPDGYAAPPPYGLVLDGLAEADSDSDNFSFDFDHAQSDMRITVDADTIRIFGTVFGGHVEDNAWGDPDWVGLWEIDFTYNSYSFAPGDDDRTSIGPDPADHWGTITALFGDGDDFWLQDESGGMDFSFRLGDKDNDNGFRGFDGISGWGWLNHAPVVHDALPRNGASGPTETFPHTYNSDWLFIVGDEVPEPGSAALLALGGLALLRRRR